MAWEAATRRVSVSLTGRTASFAIGSPEALLAGEEGQAQVAMAVAPVLLEGRTLVALPDLASIFGLAIQIQGEDLVNLTLPSLAEVGEEQESLTGTIVEIREEEGKILVEGAPMASGEPSLTWVTLFEDTELSRGAEGESITLADLEIGQEVEVVVSGAILMSYPAQAGASAVVVSD